MGAAREDFMAGQDGIEALWPTIFLRRTLPGADVANQALAAFILERDEASTDMTTDYLDGNLLVVDHPAIAWLHECINRTITDYFRALGMAYRSTGRCTAGPMSTGSAITTTRTIIRIPICRAPITCRCRRTAHP
jgi:hypothetical protein